jgi:hypothetical protein
LNAAIIARPTHFFEVASGSRMNYFATSSDFFATFAVKRDLLNRKGRWSSRKGRKGDFTY